MVGAAAVIVEGDDEQGLLPVLAVDDRRIDGLQELLTQANIVRRMLIVRRTFDRHERRFDKRVRRQGPLMRLREKISDAEEMAVE